MTTGMTNQQVRVIDPILSNVALGYKHPEHVGGVLFPSVPVMLSGGQVLEFGKESFREYNIRRAPGTGTKRIQFGYLGRPFALVQDALEGVVPFEHMRDANVMPGIDLGSRAVMIGMAVASLALEREQAAMARATANYDSDHKVDLSSSAWTDPANDPTVDIETGREAVRDSTGLYPNKLVLSAKAFSAARSNPKVVERFKYTSATHITKEMLSEIWDIRIEVGKAITTGADDAFSDVWGTDAILAYAPDSPQGQEEPSYGYTYLMQGHPLVEQAYMDRNAKSWIYPVTFERAPVQTGFSAGYLLTGAGEPTT